MSEWHQSYMIFGNWENGVPNYSVDKWVDTPKYPTLNWVPYDDNWRDVKLPRKNMKLFEIINYLHTLHSECYHSFTPRIAGEQTVIVTFRKLPDSIDSDNKGERKT